MSTVPRNPRKNSNGRAARTDQPSVLGIAVFGPFRVRATERVLEKDGLAVKIGSRAFDILVMLLQAAPAVVTGDMLMSRVWGSLVVDEGSLRFQIAALRKMLGWAPSGGPYITNVPGRGYCITVPVTWTSSAPNSRTEARASLPTTRLPLRPRRLFGRDREVRTLVKLLQDRRFLTIVGAGGIGKTTLALTIAHEVLSEFAGAVHFLDLAAIQDPRLVGGTLAAQLGLTVVSDNALPALLSYFRERHILLVLDNCEHLIEAVAVLAETVFHGAPEVHILATSREALKAEGERVHHLDALECPPPDVLLSASVALTFPAVQLFVEQVTASGYAFELNDADAPVVAQLCRRLDGIALALELAASRVGVYGLQRIASLLDDQFRLLWKGRRTALPRQQTLGATLDWSYNLLSEREQRVLRCLAIFVGTFSLEDAVAIAGVGLDAAEATEIIAALVEKSLLTLEAGAALTRYRLLDTTRTYARQRLKDSGAELELARRHCTHLCTTLERYREAAAGPCSAAAFEFVTLHVGNLQTAHEWAFSAEGDAQLGVRLSIACAPLYFKLSMLPACQASTERALNALDPPSRGTRLELELQVCRALSLHFSKVNAEAVHAAVDRGLKMAEELHEPSAQLLLLYALHSWHTRSGDFRRHMELATRIETAARPIQDPLVDAIARAFVASSSFHSGNVRAVPGLVRAVLDSPVHLSKLSPATFVNVHNVHDIGIRGAQCRSLWLLGYPDQALAATAEAEKVTLERGNPRTVATVLVVIVLIYIWTGDLLRAAQLTERSLAYVNRHQLSTYAPVGIGWRGYLAILQGEPTRGIELLQRALADLRADGFGQHIRLFSAALAQGYAKAGQHELALMTINDAIEWSQAHGPSVDFPEMLRVKGKILIWNCRSEAEGEACLWKALELAREQSLLSMELRSAVGLARLARDRGLGGKGLELLEPVFSRFTEGFATRDLVTAADLLADLRARA